MMSAAVLCLALNVYWEARAQPFVEQVAVAQVVMHRVRDARYPNTVCEVVYEGPVRPGTEFPIRDKCQFSWYCDGKSDEPVWALAWQDALEVAVLVVDGQMPDLVGKATHYHAVYVSPNWAEKKDQVVQIGMHKFYACRTEAFR